MEKGKHDFGTIQFRYREQRAAALTAHVMHLVGKYICDHTDENLRREVHNDLYEAFYSMGADIITDQDRRDAGLALRDETGLTREQLAILEAKLTMAMLTPPPPFVFPVLSKSRGEG